MYMEDIINTNISTLATIIRRLHTFPFVKDQSVNLDSIQTNFTNINHVRTVIFPTFYSTVTVQGLCQVLNNIQSDSCNLSHKIFKYFKIKGLDNGAQST